jgi:hypothetical protein
MSNCEIVADSVINYTRVTTIRYEIWRPLHSELMTYRRCARNASSSRAVPFSKNLYKVDNEPYLPNLIGLEKKGMNPGDMLEGDDLMFVHDEICDMITDVIKRLKVMESMGVHKSILNRYLEPFNTINVLMTGSADHWLHLFEQRCNPNSEPNLRVLCEEMRDAYKASTPVDREYHLPYIGEERGVDDMKDIALISAARCARLSYTPFGEPSKDTEKDLALAKRLLADGHMSPFENQIFSPDEIMYIFKDSDKEKVHIRKNAISDDVLTFRQVLGF